MNKGRERKRLRLGIERGSGEKSMREREKR